MYLETNEIISTCRISLAFWEMLTGKSEVWENPGKCVMSWLVANALDQEMIVLPQELQSKYDQCEGFSSSAIFILKGLDSCADKLVRRCESLGFKVTKLELQIESLFAGIEVVRDEAEAEGNFMLQAMNRHKLITLAGVYQKIDEQLTSQDNIIEKK
jgi:hypothetical protein